MPWVCWNSSHSEMHCQWMIPCRCGFGKIKGKTWHACWWLWSLVFLVHRPGHVLLTGEAWGWGWSGSCWLRSCCLRLSFAASCRFVSSDWLAALCPGTDWPLCVQWLTGRFVSSDWLAALCPVTGRFVSRDWLATLCPATDWLLCVQWLTGCFVSRHWLATLCPATDWPFAVMSASCWGWGHLLPWPVADSHQCKPFRQLVLVF